MTPGADPIAQLDAWIKEAKSSGQPNPDGMALATASVEGVPTVRMVLYKGVREGGLSFFTNYNSAKAQDLGANPHASALFYWRGLERQVRVEGDVRPLSRTESEAYFATRGRGSQLGAWASDQSKPLDRRETLEARLAELEAKYRGQEIPCPPFWGGYGLAPKAFEFWFGRPDRLHDRYRYTDPTPQGRWTVTRLNP